MPEEQPIQQPGIPEGITLKDYFAGLAMHALIAKNDSKYLVMEVASITRSAYTIAEDMMYRRGEYQ